MCVECYGPAACCLSFPNRNKTQTDQQSACILSLHHVSFFFHISLLCTFKQTNGGRRHDSPPATTRQHPPPSRPPSPPPRPPLASPRPPPRLPSSPLLLILLFSTIIITATTHPSFRDDQNRLLLRLRPRPWSDPRRSQTCLPRTRQEHPPGRQSYHGHHQRIPRHQRGV